MMRVPTKDIKISVSYLDLRVTMVAEGVSWSPDVAQDMVNRIENLWESALLSAATFGLISIQESVDDDEADLLQIELEEGDLDG